MSEYVLTIGGTEYRAEVKEMTAERARIVVNDTEYDVDLVEIGRRRAAAPTRPQAPAATAAPVRSATPARQTPPRSHGTTVAPLPGLVLEVKVKEGDTVEAGQTVVLMEAMKMENAVQAPHNGTVRKVFVSDGDSVGEGEALVEITRPEMTTL